MTDGLTRLRDAWEQAEVSDRVSFLQGLYGQGAAGSHVVEVQALVGGTRGEPIVELRWDDKMLQWSPETAIAHATGLIEAAEAARHDAFLCRFMQDSIGATLKQTLAMLLEMRAWRQRRAELPKPPSGVTG